MPTRKLRVFLCHATEDKPAVRKLYASLKAESWIDPWLDEEKLLPGQDWDLEVDKAIRDADAIIVCLSQKSVSKEGYIQKEIKRALDISDEKPDGTIYIIPLRLDRCDVPIRITKWQWIDHFAPTALEKLLKALQLRAELLKIEVDDLDFYRFVKIEPQETSKVSYPFWIGKYPITNAQYERFLNAPDFSKKIYWLEFPKFDEKFNLIGNWGKVGLEWLQRQLIKSKSEKILPRYWNEKDFGRSNPNHPIVGVSWFEASAYCEWLFQNWDSLAERKVNPTIIPQTVRLPLETEWVTAAGGGEPDDRYPWDEAGKATTTLKEIIRRANVNPSEIGHTTPVNAYPRGKSPFGVMDMSGNVWEWQANFRFMKKGWLGLRGGSWLAGAIAARLAVHVGDIPYTYDNVIGFRVVVIPE